MDEIFQKLNELKKEQIIEIIQNIIKNNNIIHAELKNILDSKFGTLTKQNEIDADIDRYEDLWSEAEGIIDNFNEYGGGEEEDEITACDNLDKIVDLFKKGNLDNELRHEFIENCINFYHLGNSGMEDNLVDAFFEVCQTKEDWLFAVENLKKNSSRDYTNDLIMDIYKDRLNDDEAYLKLRMDDLHYGMDYHDLVMFYDSRGEKQKAFETALEGLKKGEGRIIDLTEYLQEYYKKNNDHPNALKYYTLTFKESPSFDLYKEIKGFCTEDEWKTVSKELYNMILKNEYVKREIDYENKEYKKVFDSITKTEYSFCNEWADKLEPIFPKELLEIYKQKIRQNIEYKKVGAYYEAVSYCFRVRNILVNILHKKDEWKKYLQFLKQSNPKLPALQRELKKLDELKKDEDEDNGSEIFGDVLKNE